ncbi:heterokaryon incompatibility protein-domain-containing protein [Cercophora newfieldiana]|uniref:Heterokaryon incompatibility protein-domain-containing protein n=1 Tax=Cercophora newfieldiana TaxID=92897 RepID=A0AA40CVY2_9PEZI|nr:heterokaryon incompatibility protein-domain-containing protein [Cercophora newfieldiana]
MAEKHTSIYEALPGPTFIRVMILAPGEADDEIFCWLVPSDLDADHYSFPDSDLPRPIESFNVAEGSTSRGKRQKFMVPFDIHFPKNGAGAQQMHQFQRYSALSYVWGDATHPKYITLGGEHHFPVTENLHAVLRSLRKRHEGIRLWVDAVCINQANYEEKRVQIGLMRRVYQQAEEVVAYVPLPDQDQGNVVELIPKVVKAAALVIEATASSETGAKDRDAAEEAEKPLSSALAKGYRSSTVWFDESVVKDPEAFVVRKALDQQSPKHPLEAYDIPPVDSPLWSSWRRFFASPYFERIWILQEFSLAKNLRLHLGTKSINADFVMIACHAIKEYSGAKNADYMLRRGDDVSPQASRGLQRAWRMFSGRMQTKDNSRATLIDTLLEGRRFLATDPRDKVYALLGLAKDGELFNEHVSYAPEETPARVFARFASVLAEQGHGEAVLLQAGLAGNLPRDGLPSWVPNWADPYPPINPPMLPLQGTHTTTSTSSIPIQITDPSKLITHATIIDRIQETTLEFPRSPNEEYEFIRAFVKAAMLTTHTMGASKKPDDSPEDISDMLFSTIVRKEFHSEEKLRSLKSGFRSFLAWFPTVVEASREITHDRVAIQKVDSPEDFRVFMAAAFRSTGATRFCLTDQGCFGLVPQCAEAGDHVVMIEGSRVPFVLRDSAEKDGEYKLVGNGYFRGVGAGPGEGSGATESCRIVLV